MDKQKAQEQLQKALLTTFLANLAFLSEYDNFLYERLVGLSDAIEKGEYKERYFLEFIEENGDFDIFDSQTNEYLYKRKPKKYNNLALNSVNLDSKSEFFTMETKYYKKYNLEKIDIESLQVNTGSDSIKVVLNDISEFREVLNEDLSNIKTKKYKQLGKFIFLGTLLGRHILSIVKKHNPKHLFVCEKNLEIFRLSLFVFDYSLLARNNRTVVFSIMDDVMSFQKNFTRFYMNNVKYNASLKYYSTNYNSEEYFELIFDGIVQHNPISYDYVMTFYKQVKESFERVNNYKLLTLLKEDKQDFFNGKQVLFLGAGPSLDVNINWIKENQEQFFIVAMGASYKKLIDNAIRIDLLTTLDSSEVIYDKQFSDKYYIDKLGDTPLIAAIHTHEKVLKQFNKDNIYLYALDYPFFFDNITPIGYSVGEVSCVILSYLGVKELYLLGIDFSLNQETGETHISNSSSTSKKHRIDNLKTSLEKESFHLKNDVVKVRGNYENEVLTTRLFYQSARILGRFLKERNDLKVFNISKTAAHIDGVSYIDKDLILKQKLELSQLSLGDFLNNFSRAYMTEDECKLILSEDHYLKIFLDEFDKLKHFDINSFDHFEQTYIDLITKLYLNIKLKSSFFKIGMNRYYRTIVPYIYYHFNDKSVKNEKNKIKKLIPIIESQIKRLIKDYRNYLKNISSS